MTTTLPIDFDHNKGDEIPTKYKEAIRQLAWFGKIPKTLIERRYNLGESIIRWILSYDIPERARPGRVGFTQKLIDTRMDEITEYCSENWEYRTMDYEALIRELDLGCAAFIL
jgi:hypothetical protein